MGMLTELFGSKEGLMSLAVIVIMLGMGAFFIRLFIKNMNDKS